MADPSEPLDPTQPRPDRKANVLLVDDHPGNLAALEAILVELGQNLVRARSGEEALRRLHDDDFAVILLDVRLDGFATAKRIRADPQRGQTPIIFLTADDDGRPSALEAYKLGAVDYLTKPLEPVILRAKVAGFVERFEKTEQVKRQAEQIRQMERRDFERRLAAENARLRQSEGRFARFMQHLPGLAWIKDAEGRYVYVNDAAARAFGQPAAAVPGKTDDDLFPPATAAQFRENDRRALAAGVGVQVVETLQHPDGVVHLSIVNKFPIPGPEDGPALVGGVAFDFTDRRQAEEALRQSEEQFRTLADSIPQLAWMGRPDGYLFWYNKRWYDYTGTSPEQMEGWGWQSVHDPRELPRVLVNWKAALAAGQPWEDTFPLRRHDGAMRWHLSRALPVRDEEGRVARWFGTNTDITELRQMEEALKEADRLKDEFLAMLAHELRNPLAPIRNALHVLRQPGAASDTAARVREMAERQVKHMARLLDDLMDVSRISRGRIELRQEIVDVAALVRQALETVGPFLQERRHALDVALPAEPLRVRGDPARLEQVLTNLLNNAAKYTNPGGRISLAVAREREDVVLRVRDSGAGIAPDMLVKIFDLFVQADRRLDRAPGGVGIGLTLVRKLVELHGGRVEARSPGLGGGSEFLVRLPALAEAPPAAGRAPAKAGAAPAAAPRRILVVDDNRDAADSLAVLLRLHGQDVRVAYDGPSALAVAAEFRPALALVDIGMPDMDGCEVARLLRVQPGLKEMRLVALTGWGQEEDRRSSAAAGFDQHLVKPVEPDALGALLAGLTRTPR
jgi:PAS domain S-box-containing protein